MLSPDLNSEIVISFLKKFLDSYSEFNTTLNHLYLLVGVCLGLFLPLLIDRIKYFINSKNGKAGKKE